MSVQGHMIPDSDGEALKAFIIYKVFHIHYPCPTTCLWREWAGISLQLNLSKVKPCILCTGGLTSKSRPYWSNAAPMPFWTVLFYIWNLGRIWVLVSFLEASLEFVSQGRDHATDPSESVELGSHGQRGGD